MEKKKIIFTGGSGLLAVNWAYKIRDEYEVLLFIHKHQVNIPHVKTRTVNLENISEIRNAVTDFEADTIIHTAGMTNVDICEKEPELAYRTNVTLSENVANACADLHKRMVHISTDHLFDGTRPLVTEEEPINPVNVYGTTKAQAEEKVRDIKPDALIIRTNFYGWGHQYRTSLSDWIISLLENNKEVPAFCDSWFTPIQFDQLIDATHELLGRNVPGVFNVCGSNRISKYDFAKSIAEHFGFDAGLIRKTSINDANLAAKRPKDMSLSNEKTCRLLNKKIGELEEGITTLFNNQSHREKLREAVSC